MRSRWAVGVGALLLVLCAGAGGVLVWGAATKYDWNKIKPVWWLVREAEGSTASTASAIGELVRRIGSGKIDVPSHRRLVVWAMQRQADSASPWDDGWGDIVEAAWDGGLLTGEEIRTYCRNAVIPSLVVRPAIHVGYGVPAQLRIRMRAGRKGGMVCTVGLHGVRAEGLMAMTSLKSVGFCHGPGTQSVARCASGELEEVFDFEILFQTTNLDQSVVSAAAPVKHAVQLRLTAGVGRCPPSAGSGRSYSRSFGSWDSPEAWRNDWLRGEQVGERWPGEEWPEPRTRKLPGLSQWPSGSPVIVWREELASAVEVFAADEVLP